MSFLHPGAPRHASVEPRLDPRWARTKFGKFHRLIHLDPEAEGLAGRSGIFVVWHAGVRPQWLYVASDDDLAHALHALTEEAELMSYEVHGGLYVTWAFVRDDCQDGVVAYLATHLKPTFGRRAASDAGVIPIPVIPPGARTR